MAFAYSIKDGRLTEEKGSAAWVYDNNIPTRNGSKSLRWISEDKERYWWQRPKLGEEGKLEPPHRFVWFKERDLEKARELFAQREEAYIKDLEDKLRYHQDILESIKEVKE